MPSIYGDTDTVADLLDELGNVPVSRVLLRPCPGTAKERHLIRLLHSANKRLCELVNGTLIERPYHWFNSLLAAKFSAEMGKIAIEEDCGILTGATGPYRLKPGLVRMPAIAFSRYKSLPDRDCRDEPIADWAPDIAVEVASEQTTPGEIELKRRQYFEAGTRLFWCIEPNDFSLRTFDRCGESRVLGRGDTINGEDVLPGFALPLDEFFEKTERVLQKISP